MRKVITEIDRGILEKSPNLGTLPLRKAICDYLARSKGIIADLDQVIIGSGSEYLYTILVELLGRNRTYAIESPSYKKIQQVYNASDVQLQMLPLANNGIESQALKNCQADILHISPYRSYPSGVTASASKRHEYLRWAEKGIRYIIEDDFESEFSVLRKPEETLFSHSLRDNVIYMNTFSKTISPSFRIGYMILPKTLAAKYQEKLGFLSCTVPTYLQLVLAELIINGDFERHINRIRRAKRKQQTE
jgi:GntR family transcriptional regulator/MocR family aminotransferase